MHVCSSRDPHHAPSPWYSNWLSAEPSTQPHMRRKERYVDNRFVIFPSPASGHPAAPLEALLQADFYGAPIVLEQVFFSGFVIDVGDRAIYYKTPSKIWQIRGPRTAGSPSPPSTRIRLEQYRWHGISFAVFICPPATSQLTCNTCFIYRRLQHERTLKRRSLAVWLCGSLFVPLFGSFRPFWLFLAFALLCPRMSLGFLFLDVRVDHGAHTLVQTVLPFLLILESCRHARPHDSASSPHDPEKTNSPEPPARPAPRTPAPAPVSPCAGLFSSPESLPEPHAHAPTRKYVVPGQKKMTSSFAA